MRVKSAKYLQGLEWTDVHASLLDTKRVLGVEESDITEKKVVCVGSACTCRITLVKFVSCRESKFDSNVWMNESSCARQTLPKQAKTTRVQRVRRNDMTLTRRCGRRERQSGQPGRVLYYSTTRVALGT